MAQHKVIGLVSGGKDSCFNLLHCVANGHEILALATLTPEEGTDELDSHLYQSVGTTIPPFIARAMGIPHYSGIIKGKAVEQGPEYGNRSIGGPDSGVRGDETEDLYNLLQDVLKAHPDATAISTGAILSTYQRLRIEHVCSRLGLVSLAYLWQAEQMPLLERMRGCGMEVVLVKVAGVGLGRDMVGSSLWDQLPALRKLERIYGSHPAGEGGEYETLTLDSPLFSHRVNLIDPEVIVSDPEPNLVAYLRIPQAQLVEKEGWTRPGRAELREMLGLKEEGTEGALDQSGKVMLEELRETRAATTQRDDEKRARRMEDSFRQLEIGFGGSNKRRTPEPEVRLSRRGRWFSISTSVLSSETKEIGDQMNLAFRRLQDCLTQHSLSLPLHATHITLLLPHISLFPLANQAYSTWFGTSPPSRATVAVPLPEGVGVRVEVVGFDDRLIPDHKGGESSKERKVGGRSSLHVQSLSYWAPANIGPYSQAITVNSRAHIAGQIPLLPPTLTLPLSPLDGSSPYPEQCALALQHVRKITQVLRSPSSTGGGWTGWVESCVAWWALPTVPSGSDTVEEKGEEAVETIKAAWKIWAEQNDCEEAPLAIVRARELPKSALVEFQVNLHTGRKDETCPSSRPDKSGIVDVKGPGEELVDDDDEEDEDEEELSAEYISGESGDKTVWWESCKTSGGSERGSRGMIFIGHISDPEPLGSEALKGIMGRAVSLRIYHMADIPEHYILDAIDRLLPESLRSGGNTKQDGGDGRVLIPVYDIHDRYGRRADVVVEVFGT